MFLIMRLQQIQNAALVTWQSPLLAYPHFVLATLKTPHFDGVVGIAMRSNNGSVFMIEDKSSYLTLNRLIDQEGRGSCVPYFDIFMAVAATPSRKDAAFPGTPV